MSKIEPVDDATFAARVEAAGEEELVAVDFTAAWCGPCRVMEPVLEGLATEMALRVRFVSLDVDRNPATAARFGIRGMPTLVFLRGGREVGRSVGAVPAPVLRARIEPLLRAAAV